MPSIYYVLRPSMLYIYSIIHSNSMRYSFFSVVETEDNYKCKNYLPSKWILPEIGLNQGSC